MKPKDLCAPSRRGASTIHSDSRLRHYGALTCMLLLLFLGYSFVTSCGSDVAPSIKIDEGGTVLTEAPCPFGGICEELPGFSQGQQVEVKSGSVHVGSEVNCVTLTLQDVKEDVVETYQLLDRDGTTATLSGKSLMICRPGPGRLKATVKVQSDRMEVGPVRPRLIYIPVSFD